MSNAKKVLLAAGFLVWCCIALEIHNAGAGGAKAPPSLGHLHGHAFTDADRVKRWASRAARHTEST